MTIELTAPRIPCATLAGRMNDPQFVKRFAKVNRGGAYARVLTTGAIESGRTGTATLATDASWPTIAALFAWWYAKPTDPALIRTILAAPIAERTRRAYANVVT